MKKFTLALAALLTMGFAVQAQQYVSTEPANRNVLLEEFTGRNCGYCPDGHVIANNIAASHPDHFWAMNIHAGGFSPTSFPNLNTTDGTTINNGFGITSYPNGVVNRSTASGISRNQWTSYTNTQLGQAAECNVAGFVVLNPATRIAQITVEVYYTGNSTQATNYLTVAMLQDSIWGSQSSGASNPSQWNGSQYCHMHVLRDVITESTWGDAITPTTAGTLITRTYTYEIPEQIGNPNPVDVVLDNVFFLAYVTEQFQGTPTRPILNVNKLDQIQGTGEPIYPFIKGAQQEAAITCDHRKNFDLLLNNGGTEDITSMKIVALCGDAIEELDWEGNFPSYGAMNVEMSIDVPFGTNPVDFKITEANGQPFEFSKTITANCDEWATIEVEGDEEELKIEIMQDKFGNQTTWEVLASDMTVLASGGPYTMLMGNSGTQIHIEHAVVPANECIMFAIYDNVANGICCDFGEGYYKVYDSQNNVLIDGNGAFGAEAKHVISVMGAIQATVGETNVEVLNYTDANFISSLDYLGYPQEVGFEYRKVTNSEVHTAVGIINEFKNIIATVNDLECSSIYVVKAYAIIDGHTFYGPEATFNTWTEGVIESSEALRVYPNPASDQLTLEGAMNLVEVYNTVGQCVISQNATGDVMQLNLSGLNNGVYFLRVYNNNGEMIIRKFSVNR